MSAFVLDPVEEPFEIDIDDPGFTWLRLPPGQP